MAALEKVKISNKVRVTASLLNVRSGPGTKYKVTGLLRKNTICEILETNNNWGRINSPEGWISLEYTTKN